jgi:hypothetical protein
VQNTIEEPVPCDFSLPDAHNPSIIPACMEFPNVECVLIRRLRLL